MDYALISLLIFLAVVLLGFFRKKNVGLLAIAVSVLAARLFGLTDKDVLGGISTSLFTTLVGITLLFGVVNATGALELSAKKIVSLVGRQIWLIPIMVYIAGWVIAAVGPGAIPALAIIPPLAVSLALAVGYSPLMLSIIGEFGLMAGRMTAITPEGVLISGLLEEQGITGIMGKVLANMTLTTILLAFICYFFYRGYKVKQTPEGVAALKNTQAFTFKQICSLLGIVVMLVLIIFFDVNVGLAAFLVAVVLIMFNVAEESKCVKAVPWGTVMLVIGVGVLMNIVSAVGGVDMLSNALASIMNSRTATPIMALTAGMMSWVSSALGVVYPTLTPTVGTIISTIGGVTAVELTTAIGICGSVAGISPASTGGALILAAFASNKPGYNEKEESRLFVELFVWAALSLLFVAFIAFLGVYKIIGV